jgi:hypothetical protein
MLGLFAAFLASGASPTMTTISGAERDSAILVQGREITHAEVKHIIQSISKPESTGGFERQYPRWKKAVCVSVVGFPLEGGRYIADEIGAIARSVKLKAEGPGCSPTITVVASSNPSHLIATMRRTRYDLIAGREPAYIQHAQKNTDAVRWLSFTAGTSTDGMAAVSQGRLPAMQSVGTGLDDWGVPTMQAYDGGSLIHATTMTYLRRVIAVVDTRQITGISYRQLADYLALTSLAQVRPSEALEGTDSILGLFPEKDHAANGLTRFDRAYLTALYGMNPGSTGQMQRGQIVSSVNKSMRDVNFDPTRGHAVTTSSDDR